jgi:hypothetical protein
LPGSAAASGGAHRTLAEAAAAHDCTVARRIDTRGALSDETDCGRPDRQRVADLRRQVAGLQRRDAEDALRLDLCRQRLDAAGAAPEPAGLRERHDLTVFVETQRQGRREIGRARQAMERCANEAHTTSDEE